ncbi:MAG: DNA-directed RNA polymerase subunit alpha, partial [Candidatus Margulisiibacteriota bacterium]
INPDLKIATLDSNGKLDIEMMVDRGRGYLSAPKEKKPNLPVGYIPIDAVFSPVLKVNLTTEEVRVGGEINYDRLILSVWTNGAMAPDEAVKESARILERHIELFVHLGEKVETLGLEEEKKPEIPLATLEMNIEELELSSRSLNCLKNVGIKKVRELLEFSEADLLKLKGFGARSMDEIRSKLKEFKLKLKGE